MFRHITWKQTEGEAHEVSPTLFMQELFKRYIERSVPVQEEAPLLDVVYWGPADTIHATLTIGDFVSNMDVLMANLYLEVQQAAERFPEANITICKRDTRYPTNWFAQTDNSFLCNVNRDGYYMNRSVQDAAGCDGAVHLSSDEPYQIKGIKSLHVLGEPFTARKVLKEVRRQAQARDHFIDFRQGSDIHYLLSSRVAVIVEARNGYFYIMDERRVHVTDEEIVKVVQSPWTGVHFTNPLSMVQLHD